MADVDDVAAAFLDALGPMEAMKLEKLVYYAQAWSVAAGKGLLFDLRVEAWAQGPVVPYLYRQHRQQWFVNRWRSGRAERLDRAAQDMVSWIVDRYGSFSGAELSDLTHSEAPWLEARGDLPDGAASQNQISVASMARYYRRQIASPEEAARHAAGSAALEGMTIPDDLEQVLVQVARGDRAADEVISELVASFTARA